MKKYALIQIFPPNNGADWDRWEFRCPKRAGGCGKLHALNLDEKGEIDRWEAWEIGENFCRLTEEDPLLLREEIASDLRQEWVSEGWREQYWKENGETTQKNVLAEQAKEQEERVKMGVKVDERQYQKGFGSYCSTGYWRGKREYFICGNCSKKMRGAERHSRAKNRNNPAFWGLLDLEYKILCLTCIKAYSKLLNNQRRRMLNEYLKRGYI